MSGVGLRAAAASPWRLVIGVITVLLALPVGLVAPAPPAASAEEVTAERCSVASGSDRTFESGGVTRTYDIRVPAGADATTAMVLSLHPMRQTSAHQSEVSGLNAKPVDPAMVEPLARKGTERLGDTEGFIVVFPQAKDNEWDLRPAGYDVRFLAALTADLHARGCSSPADTSVNGYSMGAMMSARLVCAAPELFSGLGMVAGIYPPTPGCRIPATTSVVGLHGTDDWLVTWDGWVWPVLEDAGIEIFPYDRAQMVRMWAEAKGCAIPVRATFFAVVVDEYVGCPGSTTHMVTFAGGNHTWDSHGVDASRYLWSVLRPASRNPVHSGAQALMQSVAPDTSGRVRALEAGSVVSVAAGVPDSTVVGTLTVTGGVGSGFAVAFPCDQPRPWASSVNFVAGQSVASGVVVRTGADGRFCVYVSNGVHVVWDQVAATDLPGHSPVRKLDTRELWGVGSPPSAGSVVSVAAGVPDSTVVGTLTVTGGVGSGFAVAFPCDQPRPWASSVNFVAGQSVASGVVVRTGADGRFCVYVSNGVHVVWDQVAATDLPGHSPVRKLDTREVTPS